MEVRRREEKAGPAWWFEEVDEVIGEVICDAVTFDLAVQRVHVHGVVADQDIGARAGAAATDAERRNARANRRPGARGRERARPLTP